MGGPGAGERRYTVGRGDPITLEIKRSGKKPLLVQGVIDAIPWSAGGIAQKLVVREVATE